MSGYWKRVGSRALDDTLAYMGSNTRKFVFGGILTAIAAAILLYFDDASQAVSKILWWLLICVAYLLVFPVVFAFMLVRTPFVLDGELNQQLTSAETDAKEKAAAASAQIEQLRREKYEALNADPRRKTVCSELRFRRDGFERVIQGLRACKSDSVESFYDLDWQTFNYVQNHVPGYMGYGRVHPPQNTHTKKLKYSTEEYQGFISICEDRIRIMDDLLEIHS